MFNIYITSISHIAIFITLGSDLTHFFRYHQDHRDNHGELNDQPDFLGPIFRQSETRLPVSHCTATYSLEIFGWIQNFWWYHVKWLKFVDSLPSRFLDGQIHMFDMVRFHVWWRNHHFQELSPHVLGRHRSTPRCVQVVSQSWPKVEGKVLEIAESLYKNLLPGYFQMALLSNHGEFYNFYPWIFWRWGSTNSS
jgi:hypothetical protein